MSEEVSQREAAELEPETPNLDAYWDAGLDQEEAERVEK